MTFYEFLFSTEHITPEKYIFLLMFLLLIYYYIFHFLDTQEMKALAKHHDTWCFITCKHPICTKITEKLRDKKYLLLSNANHIECIFSFWEFTHLIFHIFIGYFYNIQTSLAISIPFEIFEHYYYDCGSFLDILWNFLGAVLGSYLRYKFSS